MDIVDAHVHVWDTDAFPVPWFRDDLGLPRVSSPDAYRDAARASGVSSGVAVQVADSVDEARWLTAVTATDQVLTRAVLQYEPAQGRVLGTTAFEGAAFSGIRAAVPQCAADLSDVPGLDDLADALGATGRVLELLVRPEQLAGAAALARRHPAASIVLCHLGLGHAPVSEDWRTGLASFAAAPNAHAKFSGLLSPARTDSELSAIARTAETLFGADRLMFGSDWPMSARTRSYTQVVDAVSRVMPDTPAFWSATADRLYPLVPAP